MFRSLTNHLSAQRVLRVVLQCAAVAGIAGCAGSVSGNVMRDGLETLGDAQQATDRAIREPFTPRQPVVLAQGRGTLGPAAKPLDDAGLKTAVERYAEGRRQQAGSYVSAGAVLTGDGRTRALVLFTSPNWCQPQGCDMAIFEQGNFGWKSVGTVSRVRPPVLAASTQTAGWRDLWVVTGREAKGKEAGFIHNVRLQYGANGYPGTTTFAIAATQGAPEGQAIIQTADLQVPDKARLATGGRNPDHNTKKVKELAKPAAAAVAAGAAAAAPTPAPGALPPAVR